MRQWTWSDPHVGHRLMTRLRGFGEDVPAHDAWLEGLWRGSVEHGDEIYLLGDLFFGNRRRAVDFFGRLPGRKFLVPGNHDHSELRKAFEKAGMTILPLIHLMKVEGRDLVMCHYPLYTWPGAKHGALHLHGHSHGNLLRGDERTTRTDVGVDGSWGPGPVDLVDLVQFMSKRRYRRVDHHGTKPPAP